MFLRLQPAVRGGDQSRKESFIVDVAFRLCPAYLKPNSQSMQKPIGGFSAPAFHSQKGFSLFKREGGQSPSTSAQPCKTLERLPRNWENNI